MGKRTNPSDTDDETKDINPEKKGTGDSPRWPFPKESIVPSIVLFPVVVALAFGWCLLMLLIVSFVTLSYICMKIKGMIIASAVFAAVVGIAYVVSTLKKHRKHK